MLVCEDGDDHRVFAQAIPFTDFSAPDIELFCCDGTITLLSEY